MLIGRACVPRVPGSLVVGPCVDLGKLSLYVAYFVVSKSVGLIRRITVQFRVSLLLSRSAAGPATGGSGSDIILPSLFIEDSIGTLIKDRLD